MENCQFSNKKCASISLMFTNFRRKLQVFKKGVRLNFTNFRRNLPVFKKGVRLNFTDFHQFSSKIASFQKSRAPQFFFFGRRRLKKRSKKTEMARSKRKHRKGKGTSGREEAHRKNFIRISVVPHKFH